MHVNQLKILNVQNYLNNTVTHVALTMLTAQYLMINTQNPC